MVIGWDLRQSRLEIVLSLSKWMFSFMADTQSLRSTFRSMNYLVPWPEEVNTTVRPPSPNTLLDGPHWLCDAGHWSDGTHSEVEDAAMIFQCLWRVEPIYYSGRGGEFTCLCSLSKISLSAGDALCKQAIHKFANVYEIENKMEWLACHRYVYRQLGRIVLEIPDYLQCKTQTLAAKVWLRIALRQGTVRLSKNHV